MQTFLGSEAFEKTKMISHVPLKQKLSKNMLKGSRKEFCKWTQPCFVVLLALGKLNFKIFNAKFSAQLVAGGSVG
jgi:hypothetical protein